MSQNDLQNSLWQQRSNLQVKAEVCNVLYERELARLASDQNLTHSNLRKSLKSLAFYISKAAESIINSSSPLDLDSSNASWLSPPSNKPFSLKANADNTESFYTKNSQMALIIPVAINLYGIEYIALDSIDEIDSENQKVHCNQHGWFNFNGTQLSPESSKQKLLLKPGKPVMAAACCGHQWKNNQKTTSRALSLRELLLATRINWHNFSKLIAAKR
ncbi:hypothetical protein [Psychrosphaera haliotis]|uniref:Uncharacterized protein n=1 Tax=Psychrosphaera haliotis TaxID=555083 RepID=A0A6N8F9B5_9GAMM|nr:hypothetical protein [Psychrosphaera haliotis]MUH73116.1 hypothetical protein [Psychrosphaera haliotis]